MAKTKIVKQELTKTTLLTKFVVTASVNKFVGYMRSRFPDRYPNAEFIIVDYSIGVYKLRLSQPKDSLKQVIDITISPTNRRKLLLALHTKCIDGKRTPDEVLWAHNKVTKLISSLDN